MSAIERMSYADAKDIDLSAATDAELVDAWHAHASYISHLNADDYGGDWKLVPPVAERARDIEIALRGRGLPRPTGSYLMTDNDRIDWQTGQWSPGWYYKKTAARSTFNDADNQREEGK